MAAAICVHEKQHLLSSRAPGYRKRRAVLTFMMIQILLPIFLSISVRGCILDEPVSSLIVALIMRISPWVPPPKALLLQGCAFVKKSSFRWEYSTIHSLKSVNYSQVLTSSQNFWETRENRVFNGELNPSSSSRGFSPRSCLYPRACWELLYSY